MNQIASLPALTVPTLVAAAGRRAQTRFFEFFVNHIRNPNTRRAYGRAVGKFLAWCEQYGVVSIVDVQPLHVGAYIEMMTRGALSAPTVKQSPRWAGHRQADE